MPVTYQDHSRKTTNVIFDPEVSNEIITKAQEESAIMQLAQLHGTEPDYAVSINVATTLTACLTMPLFVALYEWLI
jgi:hypothetical protein